MVTHDSLRVRAIQARGAVGERQGLRVAELPEEEPVRGVEHEVAHDVRLPGAALAGEEDAHRQSMF